MTTALARRLEKLETVQRDEYRSRWRSGIDQLLLSMDREHVTFVQAWLREHCGGLVLPRRPGELCGRIVRRRSAAAVRVMVGTSVQGRSAAVGSDPSHPHG